MKRKANKDIFKYMIGLVTAILLRLIPHPPNVEPIMSTTMPFAKRWRWLGGVIFAVLAVLIYDVLTGTLGKWSIFTAATYGLIGLAAGFYFKKRESNVLNYLKFSIVATIVYDAITGVIVGVYVFQMSWMVTIMGQIPFTAYHLAGNIVLGAIVSPLLYKWVVDNKNLETQNVMHWIKNIFAHKA